MPGERAKQLPAGNGVAFSGSAVSPIPKRTLPAMTVTTSGLGWVWGGRHARSTSCCSRHDHAKALRRHPSAVRSWVIRLMIVMNTAGSTFELLAVQELSNAGGASFTRPPRQGAARSGAPSAAMPARTGALGAAETLLAVVGGRCQLGPA